MIKAIIFDLDGVIVNTKDIHFIALNEALKKYKAKKIITANEHQTTYDGLPTKKKLEILNKKKIVEQKFNKKINLYKQKITARLIAKKVKFDKKIYNIFFELSKKYTLAIATNARSATLKSCIKVLKIKKFCSFTISCDQINKPKPHPEIYLRCIIKLGLKPKEVLVLEDSHYGRMSAKDSGCELLPIKKIKDVNLKDIQKVLLNKKKIINNINWEDSKMNVLIPMAGLGTRFKEAGYIFPKPIIEIKDKPMIQWVLESLNIDANYIFIIQKKHQDKYNLKSVLRVLKPNCQIIELDAVTEGAASTTLLAEKFINNLDSLIIANSDQFIEWNSSKSLYKFISKRHDGAILTFENTHPKWSYAKCDKDGMVTEVAEKNVISKNATVGVYYWKKGSDYVKYAKQMIKKNIRVNNEFYVCPVYNEAIKDKKKITIEVVKKMYGLGTPEDLKSFLRYIEK